MLEGCEHLHVMAEGVLRIIQRDACACCRGAVRLQLCSACGIVKHCSKACQERHWRHHKRQCKGHAKLVTEHSRVVVEFTNDPDGSKSGSAKTTCCVHNQLLTVAFFRFQLRSSTETTHEIWVTCSKQADGLHGAGHKRMLTLKQKAENSKQGDDLPMC